MNTRKKCINCGLIAFATDTVCKRCDSDKLREYKMPEDLTADTVADSGNEMHFLNYVACFMLACVVEAIALFPVVSNIGMRHSAAAPMSDYEIFSQFAAFILHLPVSILIWLTMDSYLGVHLLFSAPFIQIIIWNFMFIKLWRRMNGSDNKLK